MTTAAEPDLGLGTLRTRARIAAHVIWDTVVRPPAIVIDDVPWNAEAVTPEWLTAVLRIHRPGVGVESVSAEGGSSGSSVRRRLVACYRDGQDLGLPARFFAKTTPTILTRLSSAMAARKEGRFFTAIRPQLSIEAPVHFFSAFDRTSGRSFHLFEDLVASKNAIFCNNRSAISREQAEQIVDLLAAFHGRFYGNPELTMDLAWLPPFEAFLRTGERDGIVIGHDQAMVAAEAVIPARVLARKREIWPSTQRSLAIHAEQPKTLLHSDVHLGNWYVTGDGTMGLCDWALVCAGHWSRDFAYALSTTLAIEDRRTWERELLKRYLERMAAFGARIGFDDAWLAYRQQTFAALLMWTPTLCHPPTMPDMQPEEMSLEMIRRITAAMDDLESFDSFEAAA